MHENSTQKLNGSCVRRFHTVLPKKPYTHIDFVSRPDHQFCLLNRAADGISAEVALHLPYS
jgi:hypothetical protein